MKITFLGGRQAGFIGLLTLKAMGCDVRSAVCYDGELMALAIGLGIPSVVNSIKLLPSLKGTDLIVSVHGREILSPEILSAPLYGGINAHPCLWKYKGKDPVRRLLKDRGNTASVGVHRMTEVLDEGPTIKEVFVDVTGKRTVDEIYNVLYPVYSLVLIDSIREIERKT